MRIQKADAIIFQLVRKNVNVENGKWEETLVYPMSVKPGTLDYDFGGRSAITQTVPNVALVDRFGTKLPVVMMSGTFGLKVRRHGIGLKDGYTRLLDFWDVFEISHQSRPVDKNQPDYIYALNYYDFIYDRKYCINIDTFRVRIDARRNAFEPTYQITFTAIGKPIVIDGGSKDSYLKILLATSQIIDGGFTILNEGLDYLSANIPSEITDAIAMLETLSGVVDNLNILGSIYGQAINGVAGTVGQVLNGNFALLRG